MSGSDDDWFEKDIDEMVHEVQKKNEQPVSESGKISEQMESCAISGTYDSDYGGNYDLPECRNEPKVGVARKGDKDYVQGISGKKLKFISDQQPLNLFLEVNQPDCGFFECFEETLPYDHLSLIVKVLAKLCKVPLQESRKEFLTKFLRSKSLLGQLGKFLTNKRECSAPTVAEFLEICWSVESFGLVNDGIVNVLKMLTPQLSVGNRKQLVELQSLLAAIEADNKDPKFKEIYPTLTELKELQPDDIKPNIVQGKFSSVREYLQTHLSLLREDFIAPLRDYIGELRSRDSLDDMPTKWFYKATRFMLNDITKSTTRKAEMLLVDLKAEERDESGVWTEFVSLNSKKLMYGTLLCFTSSLEFNDMILAIVSNRDIESLAKGYIHVEIIKLCNVTNIFDNKFIMFESEVYFEPYHHVHRVLRDLNEKNFPLAKYIVDVENEPHPPDYLKGNTKYYYKYQNHTFNPMEPSSYPPPEALQMDESQLAAFQQSLSRKFSLIQGPPGTGKTFIGLKLVSALLQNTNSPILIICYTNHALDQFLSGILNITTKIVRMGNQSKHKILDEYNIKQIMDGAVNDRRLGACFYNTKNEYMKLIQEFERLQRSDENTDKNYQNVIKVQNEMRRVSNKLDELKQISMFNLLKNKKVIGMTTTFATRSNLLLQLLKTPIVIVEEAAEVLESHIIATLTQSTEHVILIGDHQQLRPKTSVYKLSQKFNMDISLFERMVNNNINSVCLKVQHRMRPEIANLIRPVIYKDLKDNENVKKYENIRGIAKNLFFVDHNVKESKTVDETTRKNIHEADFMLALANYLILQNYRPEDIVILTTYNGQLSELLKSRNNFPKLENIRITVVDNFQGEESKIVLLSLVKNNKENRIGYLGMSNRICVALSRAQEGLYVIGSMDFLARNSSIWMEIQGTLKGSEALGDTLPLKCDRHGNITNVRTAKDFDSVKSGGCHEKCDFKMPCDHMCELMCHPIASEHSSNCECNQN